jgi:tripartite-type tricarboxylate transporter receptor subunit TctC
LGALAATPSWAQSSGFPNRPIKIVPFGTAGGPIDSLARIYGEKLQQRWGQAIVVETKPGASGIIAADFVAKAPADGYTVMMTLPLTHVNNAILQAKLPYDPIKSFSPLSMLAVGGPMLVVRANAPFNTLKDLVDHARKKAVSVTAHGAMVLRHISLVNCSRSNRVPNWSTQPTNPKRPRTSICLASCSTLRGPTPQRHAHKHKAAK